jgi:hypothetical protein
VPSPERRKLQVHDQTANTIALLVRNSVVGRALSLLLEGAGYETRIIEVPPTGRIEDLLEGVDLLLIYPGLSAERRKETLALLRGTRERRMQIPVLELSPDAERAVPPDEVEGEVGIVPWPIDLEGLSREIDAALVAAG